MISIISKLTINLNNMERKYNSKDNTFYNQLYFPYNENKGKMYDIEMFEQRQK